MTTTVKVAIVTKLAKSVLILPDLVKHAFMTKIVNVDFAISKTYACYQLVKFKTTNFFWAVSFALSGLLLELRPQNYVHLWTKKRPKKRSWKNRSKLLR